MSNNSVRGSARLQGEPAEFAGIGVQRPLSICGFADGRVVNSPCCGIPVHSECGGCLNCGEVPKFDVEFGDDISEDVFSVCVIRACAQDASNSLLLQCCCLIRSVEFCGLRCPFCSTHLDESHPSLSALRALDPSSLPENAGLASVVHHVQLPPEPHIRPLCCHRVGPYPEFALLDDRRMEWSPIAPSSRGGSWVSQWVCRSCSRAVQESDIPPSGAVSCHSCQGPAAVIFDTISGALQHFCFACWQPVVGGLHPWFSQGPLRVLGSLYGSGDSHPSPPGVGTQSWFFCPLISNALGCC